MYSNILVPIALDHGPTTAQALEAAGKLCSKGGTVTLLHVLEQIPSYAAQYVPEGQMEKNKTEAKAILSEDAKQVPNAKIEVLSGHSATAITEYAEKNHCDLIIIASHKPGLQDYFLGSTAARVVRHASCAVHVIR